MNLDKEIRKHCNPKGRSEHEAFMDGVEFVCANIAAAATRLAPAFADALYALARELRAEGEKIAAELYPEYEVIPNAKPAKNVQD